VSVAEVVPNSPAAKAEIAIDDVITEVETKPTPDSSSCAAAIIAAMDAKGGKGVILNIDRKGKRTFVVLHPDK
jgi:C-terminal processing protease CtpA/Prc